MALAIASALTSTLALPTSRVETGRGACALRAGGRLAERVVVVRAGKEVSSVCEPLPPDRPLWFPGSSPPEWLDGRFVNNHSFGLINQNKRLWF